jgi:uncharacterized protein YjbI with pentapeptide repeats
MASSEHLTYLRQGRRFWNEWVERQRRLDAGFRADLAGSELFALHPADLTRVDLRGADLRGAKMSGLDLSGADLRGADLSGAVIQVAMLAGALCQRANFRGSNLFKSDLSHANFAGSDLREADLTAAVLLGTVFAGSNLSETSFRAAELHATIFADVDLRATKGLGRAFHFAASTVGIDSVIRSEGLISEDFLKGAGLPSDLIGYAQSLRAEYSSCFISHSSKDDVFADRLLGDLRERGVKCWFNDLDGGRGLAEQIDEAISRHEKLLLILSSNSMESEWVRTEIYKARMRELREKKQILFPIRIAPFETLLEWEYLLAEDGRDLAREIRGYYIPDFTNWSDPDFYRRAFEKLLKSLRRRKDRSFASNATAEGEESDSSGRNGATAFAGLPE